MYNDTIMIHDIETARQFVDDMIEFLDVKILLKSGDYAIDGHSIIGILSLDFTKPIEVEATGNISDKFIDTIAQYTV